MEEGRGGRERHGACAGSPAGRAATLRRGSFTRIAGAGHTNLAAFLPPPKRLLATEWAPSKVDYYAGVAIWSRYDPKTTRYRLVMARGGKITTLPVPWRYVPFDVDLGPGPDGRVRAVYSRCVREPGWSRGYSYLPLWTRGRGCDIYIYDFRSRREHRLDSVSTPGASEFLPALWRDRIAFVRVYQGRTGPQRALPYIYVGRLGKRGAWRRAPGGARGALGIPGPTGLDLYGRNLAFTWGWAGADREDRRIEVRLDTIGVRHAKLIGTAMGPTWRAFYLTPTFDRGRLFWGEACYGDTEPCRGRRGEVMSYRLGSLGDYFQGALGADQEIVALARDGGRLLVMRSKATPGGQRTCADRSAPLPPAGQPQCEVILDADVTFDPFAGPGG